MEPAKLLVSEITQYLHQLNIEQQKAVLTVVKTFAQEEPLWTNKEYIAEMNMRFEELKNGKVKGLTLEEMEAGARQAYKNKKVKK